MTNSQTNENAELPVVLGYQMPKWEKVAIIAVGIIFITAGVLLGTCALHDHLAWPLRASAVALTVWGCLLLDIASAFECMTPGMNIQGMRGRVYGVRWEDARTLRRLIGPLVLLRLRKRRHFLFALPKPVTDRLVSLLREMSDARIVGLD